MDYINTNINVITRTFTIDSSCPCFCTLKQHTLQYLSFMPSGCLSHTQVLWQLTRPSDLHCLSHNPVLSLLPYDSLLQFPRLLCHHTARTGWSSKFTAWFCPSNSELHTASLSLTTNFFALRSHCLTLFHFRPLYQTYYITRALQFAWICTFLVTFTQISRSFSIAFSPVCKVGVGGKLRKQLLIVLG